MKASLVRVASLCVLTLAGVLGTATAQSAPTIKARIPFDFVVGNQTLPAGEYRLARPTPNLVLLRDAQGSTVALAFTRDLSDDPQAPLSSTMLKFEVVNGRRELIEAWSKDETEGLRLSWTNHKQSRQKENPTYQQASAISNR
jgi:hypothetical protein